RSSAPICCKRSSTGSRVSGMASPMKMSMIVVLSPSAMNSGISDLDVHDLADEHKRGAHHGKGSTGEHLPAQTVEQFTHVVRRNNEQEERKPKGHEAHHVARHLLLRGQHLNLTLDANALPHRMADDFQHLGEVAPDFVIDEDSRDGQV